MTGSLIWDILLLMISDITKQIINKINSREKNKTDLDNEREYFIFHKYRFEIIFSLLRKYNKSDCLLDIGAHYMHGLLGAYYLGYKKLFGIDLDIFNSITIQRAKSIEATLKNCDLSKNNIPFEKEVFDIILLAETLEHLNFHPDKVFKEISRILKSGGEIIITTPNIVRLNNRLKLILGKSIHQDIKKEYTPGTHYREYSVREIMYLLNKNNIDIKKLKYVDFNYPDSSIVKVIINKMVGFVFPKMKSNIIIVGRKK